MARYSNISTKDSSIRFFDNPNPDGSLTITTISEDMTEAQKRYTVINNAHTSNSKTVTVNNGAGTITFGSTSLATVPSGFPSQTTSDFTIFINGVAVEKDAVTSVEQSSSDVVITLNTTALGYSLESTDEYMITGKLDA